MRHMVKRKNKRDMPKDSRRSVENKCDKKSLVGQTERAVSLNNIDYIFTCLCNGWPIRKD